MLKVSLGLCAATLMLAGCSGFQTEEQTEEVVIGDCLNGALLNQATFGGPVRCGPQAEVPYVEVPEAQES